MTVIVSLLIGNQTWELHERCLRSFRTYNPDMTLLTYYSLDQPNPDIFETLSDLQIEAIDIGRPGLLDLLSSTTYSHYNTLEFNIKTSFKWLAILGAMTTKLDNVIFIDSDIKVVSPLPILEFEGIWEHFDIFVQDEGTSIFPKHPCTGFIGFKFGQSNISLIERLHKEQSSTIVSADSQHDQTIFYDLISRDIDLYKSIFFLSQNMFPVGYLAPIYKNYAPSSVLFPGQENPILYHANWTVGVENKALLMDSFNNDRAALPTRREDQSHDDLIC